MKAFRPNLSSRKIELSDFEFIPAGYGHYKVIYTSPLSGNQWRCKTDEMPLIDATKNADAPKVKDLEKLKKLCKNYALAEKTRRENM